MKDGQDAQQKEGLFQIQTAHGWKRPAWSDVSKEELEKTIMKLHDSGLPTKIGLTLRDQYGVPSVKLVLGKNMNSFLKENNALPEIPEDLSNLMRNALQVRKHLKANVKDVHNKRALQLMENKIRRLVKYYHDSGGWHRLGSIRRRQLRCSSHEKA